MKEFKFSTPVVDALKYDKNSKYIDARAFEAEIEVIKSNSYPTKGHEYYQRGFRDPFRSRGDEGFLCGGG